MREFRPITLALSLACLAPALAAQEWQPGSLIDVVRRAAVARSDRDADTVLAGYQARARGLLRFSAVIDHGGDPVERVIKADQLEVEVYGEAPSRSKQVIVAWRDTTFQPTGIIYHRDHLGIVANDFGPTIRLGEGDEVRDVPHPLSTSGLEWYRFRMGDTVEIRSSSGVIRVVAVEVRPRDPDVAGVIGTMLLDLDRAMLVRFRFTFSAAAYRDPTVSSITVQLEGALHGQARWLPWRQSIAIHRASPWLALPLSTVIRADWTIDDYQLGVTHPPGRFGGVAIGGLRAPGGTANWQRSWQEHLATVPASDAELDAARGEAARLMAAGRLDGMPTLRLLAAQGLSSLLRVNRVQGITVGAGVRLALGPDTRAELRAGAGTGDGGLTGHFGLSRNLGTLRVGFGGGSQVVDVHHWPRRSGLANSLATLMAGDDAGDWLRLGTAQAFVERDGAGLQRLSIGLEWVRPLDSHFTSLSGERRPNPEFDSRENLVARARMGSGSLVERGWRVDLEAASGDRSWWRAVGSFRRPTAIGTLDLTAGVGSSQLPADRGLVLGGAGSLPGTVPRSLAGTRAIRAEVAWPIAVAIPAPLWSTPLASRVTPFVAAGWAGGSLAGSPWHNTEGVQPVLGLRLDLWGPLLRIEAGWAPRDGGLKVSVDAQPDWWPLL